MKKKLAALVGFTLLIITLAIPVYGATISDLPDNSLILGQDVFDLTSTSSYNFANSLGAAATGSNIYYKFNGHWFNLCDGSVTKFSDYFNSAKYIDASAASWPLRKWYKSGSTVSDFRPTLTNITVGGIAPIVTGTATAPILTFNVNLADRYSTGTATLSEDVSYNIKNAEYDISATANTTENLMTTALQLMALRGNGSTSISGENLVINSPVTVTITGSNGTTVYTVNFVGNP